MSGTTYYTYQLSGRRPAMILVLGLSLIMGIFAAQYKAEWYFFLPVGLSFAMALWAIITNPKTGSVVTAQTLHYFYRNTKETIYIKDIATMKVTNWSDGPDTVALTMKSGKRVDVPSLCADSKLARALKELGIKEV
jgi:hypothetical protein